MADPIASAIDAAQVYCIDNDINPTPERVTELATEYLRAMVVVALYAQNGILGLSDVLFRRYRARRATS